MERGLQVDLMSVGGCNQVRADIQHLSKSMQDVLFRADIELFNVENGFRGHIRHTAQLAHRPATFPAPDLERMPAIIQCGLKVRAQWFAVPVA